MSSYSVGPNLFVRLCGLPSAVLDRLVLSGSWTLAQEILSLDDSLGIDAERLGADLFNAISRLPRSPLKPRLVALRRCVHRKRFPAKSEWSDDLAEALPAEVARRVDDWLELLRLRAEKTSTLGESVTRDALKEVTELIDMASDPLFQHALVQASPALLDAIDRGKALGRVRHQRRVTAGIAKYVARAAAKTSPYSTFTSTAQVAWTAEGAALTSSGNTDVRCVLELDRMLVDQLVKAIFQREDLRHRLWIRVNPSVRESGGHYSFLGRRPAESLVTIPVSLELSKCLGIVGDGCLAASLWGELAERSGQAPDVVAAFCGKLVDIGLLEFRSPSPDQSEEPLDDLAGFLAAAGHEKLPQLLRELREGLDELPSLPDVQDFRTRRAETIDQLACLGREFGLDWPESAILAKFAFHENAVRPYERLSTAISSWRPILDDLDVVRQWLTLHDRMLPVRLALAEYAKHRFGELLPVGFLDLHVAVQIDLARPEEDCPAWLRPLRPFLQLSNPVPAEVLEHSPVPVLALLHRLRRESLATVLSGECRDGVIHVSPAVLAHLVAQWPSWIRTRATISCYVQPYMSDNGRLMAAVNTIGGGYGKGRGRWSRLIGQAGGQADGMRVAEGGDSSTLVAELSGTFGASVNLRAPVTPFEIDYPYTTSTRPARERILLNDLMVRLDPTTSLLEVFSRTRRARVQPAHLGMMADPLLPPAARLLMAGFGQSYLLHPSLSLLREPHGELGFQPRVEIGRVVVQRAEWLAAVERVPLQGVGESDADHLLRLAGWLKSEGIPRRCFVRLRPTGGDWMSRVFAKSRKPMFIDFSSMSLVAVFKSMTKDSTGVVVFEEALPDPAAASPFAEAGQDSRVAEFVLELAEEGTVCPVTHG